MPTCIWPTWSLAGGRAWAIDFDDAGFGAIGYDMASALAPARLDPAWPGTWAAIARGYATVLPVPDALDLDGFIVARLAGLALWVASMAQHHADWRRRLPDVIDTLAGRLRRLIDTASPPPGS